MARKRMIDPEIWTDARFAFLSDSAKVLYVGMISQADDEGRIELSPEQFSLRICVGKKPCEVVSALVEVLETKLVLAYEQSGALYAYHPKWNEYQKVSHPTKSRFPSQSDPDSRELSGNFAKILEDSGGLAKFRERSRSLRPRSVRLDQVRLDQVRSDQRGSGKSVLPAPPAFGDLEPDVLAYLANAAAENKTGKISPGRDLTLRRELQSVQAELGEVFGPALREANKHGAPNANYVRRVAEGLARRGATPLAALPDRALQHGYLDGEKCPAPRGQEPNGWMTAPPRGRTMAELWPEHKNYGTDYEPSIA